MDLDQVTLPCTELDRSVRFYRALGLRQIVSNPPDYARFECPVGAATLSLHRVAQVPADHGVVVYFELEDLDERVRALEAQGLRFDSGPRDQPWLWREATLRDPDGNLLCLFRAGANRRSPPWRLPDEDVALRPVRVVGSPLSPYVRKVLVCLALKGLRYEIDPIVPFYGDDAFGRISPLRRIPVLIDDRVALPDSAVICEYLEDRHPSPPILPRDPADRARARWLEAFADTRMGDVFVWGLFDQRVIRRFVWGEPPDEERLRRTLEEDAPRVLDQLESWLPAEGHLFGPLGVADAAIAAPLRNAAFAGFTVDADRWPVTAAYVTRVLEHPAFAALRPFEELLLRTPIAKHRDALREAGAPVSAQTFAAPTPRRGVMRL